MPFDISILQTYTLFGNTGEEYARFVIVFVLTLAAMKVFRAVVIARLRSAAEKTSTDIDDLVVRLVDKVHWPFYVFIALYVALRALRLSEAAAKGVGYVVLIAATYYIVRALGQIVGYLADRVIEKRQKEEKAADAAAVYLLGKIAKISLWMVGALFVLSNFGIDITSMVAGLGIGGIAVALALQNVLSDVFSSFSIYFDRPFQIGDFIIVGDHMGVVKNIGIKSTRIQALQGEEIVISNRELTSTRIQNFKKMEKRRIAFGFGVTYQTPARKLEKAKKMVWDILEKEKLAEPNRVHFKAFGDSSLNFEAVYYVKSGDYNEYMNTQESINLAIMAAFQKEGIDFAYPTRTIYMSKA